MLDPKKTPLSFEFLSKMENNLDKFETLEEKQADLKADLKADLQNKVNSNSRLTKIMLVILKLFLQGKLKCR